MEFKSTFDPHAKILKQGQYKIMREDSGVSVPIRHFKSDTDEESSVAQRIEQMKEEINAYEEQLTERKRLEQENTERRMSQVRDEARKVMEDAEQHAFDRIQKSVSEKETILRQSKDEANQLLQKAESDSKNIINEAEKEAEIIKAQAEETGFEKGCTKAYESTKKEISYVIDRLHSIVAETARERERILLHSEQQVINLVLTMVGKIVKKLSLEHKEVVVENVKAALQLLRSAITLFIRVSPQDFNMVVSQKEELIKLIESKAEIKFIEDPTVEPGGIYIESDTGDVDATINSQLEELERQMRFYIPVKVKTPKVKNTESIEEPINSPEPIPPTPFAESQEAYGKELPEELRYTEDAEPVEEIVVEKTDDAPVS